MGFNYGLEKKKFDEMWNERQKEYEKAGMSVEAIKSMKDFDWEIFNQERRFRKHNQYINDSMWIGEDEIEEGKSALLNKFLTEFSFEDKHFEDRKNGWIEMLDNDKLTKFLKVSSDTLEILTEYVFNDKNQVEIATHLGVSQSALSQKMKTIRKNLKKFL